MRTVSLFRHHVKAGFLGLGLAEGLFLGILVLWAGFVRFGGDPSAVFRELAPLWPKAAFFALAVLTGLVATGLYHRRLRVGLVGVARRVLIGLALSFPLMSLGFYVFPDLYLGRGILAVALVSALPGLLLLRTGFGYLVRHRALRSRVLVLGTGKAAAALARFRRQTDHFGMDFVGYVPVSGEERLVDPRQILDREESLCGMADGQVDEIVVAVDERRGVLPMEDLLECRIRGVEVTDILTFLERETGKIKLDLVSPGWLTYAPGFSYRGVLRRAAKRTMDVAVSLVFLVFAAPVMAVTAAAILLEPPFGGPVLYRQTRVGEGGRTFSLIKFRSMRVDAEKEGDVRWAESEDPRVTRVGTVLRKYRLDELPQLFNILRGEMSFVGPRPERPELDEDLLRQLPYYSDRYRVKPGLTGWAQISYPYGASVADAFEKLEYDLYYVKNFSFFLDLMILLQTTEVVVWGKGAR